MSKIGKIRKIIKNPKKKYTCCRVGKFYIETIG